MKIIDFDSEKLIAERKTEFFRELDTLQKKAEEFYPGCKLALIERDQEAPPSKQPPAVNDSEFLKLGGIDKMKEILSRGPRRASDVYRAATGRGAKMSPALVRIYLTRGRDRKIFEMSPDKKWSIKTPQPVEPPML